MLELVLVLVLVLVLTTEAVEFTALSRGVGGGASAAVVESLLLPREAERRGLLRARLVLPEAVWRAAVSIGTGLFNGLCVSGLP